MPCRSTEGHCSTGLATAGLWKRSAKPSAEADSVAKRTLRVAFLTDSHLPVSPGENARMSRMLDRVLGQPDKPELVVFGGDNVMAVDEEGMSRSHAASRAQFDNWVSKVMARLNCPASLSVIGNHDIFWKEKEAAPAGDPKRRAMKAYRMPNRYYSQQIGGWKFILLDTFHADGCRIDDPQFQWLERGYGNRSDRPDLARPHLVRHWLSRIQGLFQGQVRRTRRLDHHRRRQAQGPLPSLSACQAGGSSGACIKVDPGRYQGVNYICGGAVGGNWWAEGKYIGFGPAYVMLDLFAEGNFRHEVIFWE